MGKCQQVNQIATILRKDSKALLEFAEKEENGLRKEKAKYL
jgi:hypothetical protein